MINYDTMKKKKEASSHAWIACDEASSLNWDAMWSYFLIINNELSKDKYFMRRYELTKCNQRIHFFYKIGNSNI